MPTCTPLLDALKAEKSAQRDKEAIQMNHLHYKDGAQASRKDDSKTKATTGTASGATSGGKQGGSPTAPLGERAAKRAVAAVVAAELASAQAGSTTLPKTRNASAAPPVAKPSPSSPSKGKSGRGSKHQLKPSSTSPGQATSTPPPSSSPPFRLRPHLRLLVHLRTLMALKDGRGRCLDSRQGSSRRPSVMPKAVETGGSAQPKGEREGKGAREG